MSPTFRALRIRNYRRYALGSVVSNIGTWMQRIAQDWLVLTLGGGGVALGVTTGLQFLPILLLSAWAGVLADRVPKRRLLQVTQGGMMLAATGLGLLAVTETAQVWHVYVLALGFGVFAAVDGPARQSFVAEMVGPEDITNAVGLNSAAFNLARLIGPALAGLLIHALGDGTAATGWVILLNAVSYVAVIAQLQRMDVAALHTPQLRGREPGALREGVRYVRSQPHMVMILILVFFAGTFGMNFQVASALIATDVFDKGAGEYGILGSAVAVGSLAAALLAARRVRVRLRLLVLAGAGFGTALLVASLMPTYTLFAAMAPVIGLCSLTMLTTANATLQLTAAPQLRGRVMALYMTVVMGGTPLGSPVIGVVGDWWGARWTFAVGGLMTLLGVGLALTVYARATGGWRALLADVGRVPRQEPTTPADRAEAAVASEAVEPTATGR